MTDSSFRDQLQASLGTTFTIQREIGGGGMSRVFLARDESLGRDIVIKVLPPELAAEMSTERFTREIKLAAAPSTRNKADYFLREGDLANARIYHDSIIAKLANRNISGQGELTLRGYLAVAYAAAGRIAEARAEINRAKEAGRKLKQFRADGVTPAIDRRLEASVLAYAGEHEAAVRELRVLISESAWTARGLYHEPKMLVLRGNPAFEAFGRED